MTWGAIGGAAVGVVGGALLNGSGSSQSGSATTTTQQQLDPRIAAILFGDGSRQLKPGVNQILGADGQVMNPDSDYTTNSGLLSQYQGMLGTPQDPALAQYGKDNLGYLGNAPQDMSQIRNAATGLLSGGQKVTATGQAPMAYAVGNMVQAPSQNNLDLSGAYNKMINGDAGANPYLTKAIQGGIDQSTNQFSQMQGDLTDNLKRNILPQIGSSAILAGQYGGSRQGVAEGNAISDLTKQLSQSATQFGQNNTNAAVGAQATAYGQGQDRSLAALQGLSAQQYGVAGQDAATKNAAEFGNVSTTNNINANWATRDQQAQTTNQGAALQGTLAGAGLLSGQLAGSYGVGQNQDSYQLNQAGKVNSLLAPYLGLNGSTVTNQPLYQNTGGNILGGATAGLGIWNGVKNSGILSGVGGNPSYNGGASGGSFFDGYGYLPNGISAVQ